VRVATGANQNVDIQTTQTRKTLQKSSQTGSLALPKRLVQNQAPQLARERSRASGYSARIQTGENSNNRGPSGFEGALGVVSNRQNQLAELARSRQKPTQIKERIRLEGIKSAEGPVVTGITEGTGQMVRLWGPHATSGVETPPNRPGLAVVKRVSAIEAEPGDTLTYVIMYRNMGNTPIRAVAIVDSLMPRLEYVPGTSRGPEGTTFTTAANRIGSAELRWVLPGIIPPGASGHVSFQVIVR
jgi:uncharacterized repeat protein (TIGR01451 family)